MEMRRKILAEGKRLIVIVLLILVGLCVILQPPIDAAGQAGGAGIVVSTLRIELNVPPGETTGGSFTVTNTGTTTETVEVYYMDWDLSIDGEHRLMPAGSLANHSLDGFITVTPSVFEIRGGESKRIDYSVTIPPDIPGPHWGLIVVKSSPHYTQDVKVEGGFVASYFARQTFGIKIIQSDTPNSLRTGHIVSAGIELSKGDEQPELEAIFENTGNCYLSPTGYVNIINETGEVSYSTAIDRFRVLPGYRRRLSVPCDVILPAGQYVAILALDYGGHQLVGAQIEFEVTH